MSVIGNLSFVTLVRSILLFALLVCPLTSSAAAFESSYEACDVAIPIELNSTFRGPSPTGDESLWVRVDVPLAGLLSLDLSATGIAEVEPRIGFAGHGCGSARSSIEPAYLSRSASNLVLVVESSGAYLFRIASSDPLAGQLRLDTGFAANSGGSGGVDAGEDEEEIEIDPDPFAGPVQGPGRPLSSLLHELCRSEQVDDHGDSFRCATFLSREQRVFGELSNGWGDDRDVFAFQVGSSNGRQLWNLSIELEADVETVSGLYDHSGRLIARNKRGAGSQSVRALTPGRYFLIVDSVQPEGGLYALSVNASPW